MSTVPVMHGDARARDARGLLLERGAVLLGRAGRILRRAWIRLRQPAVLARQTRPRPNGLGLGAVMGRALTGSGGRSRVLAVEERLTLGPKQHMYVIRCGERRLLVASAGEAALQWMPMPLEDAAGSPQPGAQRKAEQKTQRDGRPGAKARAGKARVRNHGVDTDEFWTGGVQ